MKKVTLGMCLLASAALAVAVAHAQQSGTGTGAGSTNSQDARQRQGAAQEQTLPDQQRGAFGQNPLYLPGAPREQAGQQIQPRQPGIETRQNVVAPGNRFGQQRGFNYQGGVADPMPTPAERQAQGLDSEMQATGRQRQYGAANQGERGELGVWLAASAGPGVEIRRVTEGSAADEIGLQPGDVLLQVNGRAVASPTEVQRLIRGIPAGQTVALEVWRDGNQQEVSATLRPMRENYRSGYRGDDTAMPAPSGGRGLEARTMRLEEQLSRVMREVQQLRQQISQLHPELSGALTGSGTGMEERAQQPQAGVLDRNSAAQPEPFADEPATTQPGLFDEEPAATQPANEPESPAAAKAPATEPEPAATEAESAEPADDLFGKEPAQPKADATPAEETDTKTKTETGTDSLFE